METHAYTHMFTHAHRYRHIWTQTQSHTRTHTYTHVHTDAHTYTETQAHLNTCVHVYPQTGTYVDTCTHAHTYAHIHAHKDTYRAEFSAHRAPLGKCYTPFWFVHYDEFRSLKWALCFANLTNFAKEQKGPQGGDTGEQESWVQIQVWRTSLTPAAWLQWCRVGDDTIYGVIKAFLGMI